MGQCCCRGSTVADSTEIIQPKDSQPSSSIGNVLIFVNPTSGAGKGAQTFKNKVESQFRKNNINYEYIITTGANHAKSIVATREDLQKFDGIVILSGDGLVFEVLNGLCLRKDASEIIPNMPIAVIPSGSGNGLLSSMFAAKGWSLKNPSFTNQAIAVATAPSPSAAPVSLFRVQTEMHNYCAFLSVGWGLMADIDIESEKYRSTLGSNRFTVSALARCLNLRTYQGRLSYKPYVEKSNPLRQPFAIYGRTKERNIESCQFEDSRTNAAGSSTEGFWSSLQYIQLPNLEDEVPDDWIVVDDEFVNVYAVTLSHISTDGPFMPQATLDDDKIYLTYILRKDLKSKMALINMLIAIEKAKHLEVPFVKTVQVSAFRLEPHEEGSRIVVDGEVIDAPKIQASTSSINSAIFT